jgi:hypothetical protein
VRSVAEIVTETEETELRGDQLNAVSEWVVNMAAADAGNIIYFAAIDTCAPEIKKCRLRSYGNGAE